MADDKTPPSVPDSRPYDDTQQLIAIQQELEQISERLRKIFGSTHPQFDDVFEDIGAAGYYKRASWLSSGISS